MKNIISKLAASLFALALTCSAASLHAQGPNTRVKVDVPFAFEVGTQHFAAGVYNITRPNPHILSIHGASNTAFTMVNPDSGVALNATGKVTFRKIGEQYFLRAVSLRGEATTLKCVQSAAEQKAQKIEFAATHTLQAGTEVAVLQMPRE